MRSLFPKELQHISGALSTDLSTYTPYLTQSISVIAGIGYFGLTSQFHSRKEQIGHCLVGAVVGKLASYPINKGIDNGIFIDYLSGDICAVIKKLWPFQSKRAASY